MGPVVGELSGLASTCILPILDVLLSLGCHVACPGVVLCPEQGHPVLVAVDLPRIDASRRRAGTTAVPAVGMGNMGDRSRAVAAWIVAIEPRIIVAAASAVVVAADAAVIEPAITAGVDKSSASTRVAVAIHVAGIIARVVAGNHGGCTKSQDGGTKEVSHHAGIDDDLTLRIQ